MNGDRTARRIRVLLVDDQPLARRAMRQEVPWSRFGMEVCAEAANGNEALRILSGHEVDVVFTDMKMPLSDGNDLLLKARTSGGKPRFVVLSGYSDYPLVRRAFRLGAYDYILKSDIDTPRMEDLLRRLQRDIREGPGKEGGPRRNAFYGTQAVSGLPAPGTDAEPSTEERRARMAEALARADFAALSSLAAEILDGCARRGAPREELCGAATDFHLRLAHGLYDRGLMPPEMGDDPAAVRRTLDGMDTARDVRRWIEEGIRAAERRFHETRPGRPVEAVLRHIDRNLERPLGVADLAAALGMSRTRLHALFAAAGLGGPKRCVADRRIRRAREYLATTDLKVEEVAALTGYGSVEHFSRAFKKGTGLSPSAFRAARKGGAPADPSL